MGWLSGYSYHQSIPVANPTTAGNRAFDAVTFPAWFLRAQGKITESDYADVHVTAADGTTELPCELNAAKTALYIDYASMPPGHSELYVYYGKTGASAPTACSYKTLARADITALPTYSGESGGTLLDLEEGADGAAIASPWAVTGSPQHAEYDTAQAKVGTKSGWVQGPSTAAYGGICTATPLTSTYGSEVRFWLYLDTTNQIRQFDDTDGTTAAADRAWSLSFSATGKVTARTNRAGNPNGYTTNSYVEVGTYTTGWTEFRIIANLTDQTYTLSMRSAFGDAWTPLKATAATGYAIPMYGSNTITGLHGFMARGYTNANVWVDSVRYGVGGISDTSDATSTVVQFLDANGEVTAEDDTAPVYYVWGDDLEATYLASDATTTYYGAATTHKAGWSNAAGALTTPQMTSNTAPSGVVSASTEGAAAWQAFDWGTNAWSTSVGATTGWLQYQFGVVTYVGSYTITANSATSAPKAWTFKGSNNGTDWTTLDTQSNITGWSAAEARTYTLATEAAYTYYRLDVTENNGSTVVQVRELAITAPSAHRFHALYKPAESAIPVGTVDDAKLYLYATPTVAANGTLKCYPFKTYGTADSAYWSAVKTGWGGQASFGYPTWAVRMYDNQGGATRAWETAGATGSNEIDTAVYTSKAFTTSDNGVAAYYDVPITASWVNDWQGDTYSQGVLIKHDGESGNDCYLTIPAPGQANAPVLVLSYSSLSADQLTARKIATNTDWLPTFPMQANHASSDMEHGFMVQGWTTSDQKYDLAYITPEGRIKRRAKGVCPTSGRFHNNTAPMGLDYDSTSGRFVFLAGENTTAHLVAMYSDPYDPMTWHEATTTCDTAKSSATIVNGVLHAFVLNVASGSLEYWKMNLAETTPVFAKVCDVYHYLVTTRRNLASNIDASQTTITADGSVIGDDGYLSHGVLLIDDELIWYTGRSGSDFTGCIRGAFGSTAASHTAGTLINPNEAVPTYTDIEYDEHRSCFHVTCAIGTAGKGSLVTYDEQSIMYLRHYIADADTVWKGADDVAITTPMHPGSVPLISDPARPAFPYSINCLPDGTLLATYMGWNTGASPSPTVQTIARLAHDATTWTLTTTGGNENITMPLAGNSVALAYNTSSPNRYLLKYSTDSGETWGDATALTTHSFPQRTVSHGGMSRRSAVDSTGLLYYPHATYYGALYVTALNYPLFAPSDLTATYNNGSVDLSWTDNAATEEGFYVERQVDGGAWEAEATIATPNTTTYTDSTVSAGHTYRYRVASYLGSQVSAWAESNTLNNVVEFDATADGVSAADATLSALIVAAAESHGEAVTVASLTAVLSMAAESAGFASVTALLGDIAAEAVEFAASALGSATATASIAALTGIDADSSGSSVVQAVANALIAFVAASAGRGNVSAYYYESTGRPVWVVVRDTRPRSTIKQYRPH